MSESDSTPRRRPPTIDLTATEVDAEKPAAGPGASDPAATDAHPDTGQQAGEPTSNRPRSSVKTAVAGIAAGAAGAIAVVAIGAGLWFGGYVPPGLLPVSQNPQPPTTAAIADISARLSKIEGAIATQKPSPPPQPDSALASRLAAAEAATKSLSDSLAALTHRVDDACRRHKTRNRDGRRPRGAVDDCRRGVARRGRTRRAVSGRTRGREIARRRPERDRAARRLRRSRRAEPQDAGA